MAQILGRMNRVLMLLSRPIIFSGSTPIPSFSRFLSILSRNPIFVNQTPLLQTVTPTIQQSCGMKVKGRLRRRCKDCYFVWREERLYVMCKTHGRHKQMSMKRKPKNTWILTHASQSKMREW